MAVHMSTKYGALVNWESCSSCRGETLGPCQDRASNFCFPYPVGSSNCRHESMIHCAAEDKAIKAASAQLMIMLAEKYPVRSGDPTVVITVVDLSLPLVGEPASRPGNNEVESAFRMPLTTTAVPKPEIRVLCNGVPDLSFCPPVSELCSHWLLGTELKAKCSILCGTCVHTTESQLLANRFTLFASS